MNTSQIEIVGLKCFSFLERMVILCVFLTGSGGVGLASYVIMLKAGEICESLMG